MNSALLAELQRQSAYPSVTVLLNTSPGSVLSTAERVRAGQLLDTAAARLRGDVDDDVAADIMDQLRGLLDEQSGLAAGTALALCVSPAFAAAVRLGRTVTERVVIDDTFATRDLVADLNRTAEYRLLTISDRTVRSFVGDRQRLVEERDEHWPLRRLEEHSATGWTNAVSEALRTLHQQHPLPTVIAGVDRSVRRHTAALAPFHTIGFVPGNHDRTSWAELHNATWPVVTDWLRSDAADALQRLDVARSSRRYAGGVQEIWPLANDGRIDTLVVEDGHALPARITDDGQLDPSEEVTAPDVVDDIVDETIEAVLRHGGRVVVTEPGELAAHHHIAAVLRY
jgi:hypothetical protein